MSLLILYSASIKGNFTKTASSGASGCGTSVFTTDKLTLGTIVTTVKGKLVCFIDGETFYFTRSVPRIVPLGGGRLTCLGWKSAHAKRFAFSIKITFCQSHFARIFSSAVRLLDMN